MTVQELNKSLGQFYSKARNKDGGNYSHVTLFSLRNGIERYLNTPPISLGIKFNADPRFVLSNQMLDAKIKELKKEGQQNTTHKPAIEKEDLRIHFYSTNFFLCFYSFFHKCSYYVIFLFLLHKCYSRAQSGTLLLSWEYNAFYNYSRSGASFRDFVIICNLFKDPLFGSC